MYSSPSSDKPLSEVENAITICEKHLEETNTRGSEIEAYLTRYLLVLVCGEYEKRIKQMIVERANRTKDLHFASFVDKTYHKSQRGLKLTDIRGNLLRRFSESHVTAFDNKIKPNDDAAIKYQNIVVNRHAIAHGLRENITFRELVDSYRIAQKVIDSLAEVLGA